MKYRENESEPWKELYIKALDSMPIGSVVEYVGQASDIPTGWEAISGGKIQKTSETTPTMASIVNVKNNSTTDGYSCKFINDSEKYSTTEVKTNKTWIDGKPIYRKVIETNFASGGSTQKIYTLSELGLTNMETVIELNSFSQGNPMEQDYYSASNDLLRTLINAQGLGVIIGSTYPARPVKIYTIIEYTKTTD